MAKKAQTIGIPMERRRYRLTGIEQLLGSQPASQYIHSQYIASRAPTPEIGAEETEMIVDNESGVTVFYRDVKHGDELSMLDIHFMGFFKEALGVLKTSNGMTYAKAKVDKYLFVFPRVIHVLRNGKPLTDEDDVFERPLRGQTPMGERNALASSEVIDTPWEIEIEIALLENEVGKKAHGKALTFEAVEQALDYGKFKGLGQYRNGSYGRFEWQRLD